MTIIFRLLLLLCLFPLIALAQNPPSSNNTHNAQQATGTATTAAWTSATGSDTAVSVATTNLSTVALTIDATSTFSAGALNFEISNDSGTTWFTGGCVRAASIVSETGYTIAASTKVAWRCNVAGYTNFRVRLNPAITGSGTASLRLQASAAPLDTTTVVGGTVTANAGSGTFTVDGSGVTQPVSGTVTANAGSGTFTVGGTVTTTPPSNASTNISQMNGVTVQMGAGASGTGTQRVVLSSDSELAANQSVNNAQVNGSTIQVATNSMNTTGAGLQAVALTAQCDNTSPTSLTENQWGNVRVDCTNHALKTDILSLAGNAVDANNGTAAAGTQRVTLASDSTGNIATIGTSVTPGTGAANLGKAEDAAHSSGDVGVMALGVRTDTRASLAGATGDYVPFQANSSGDMRVEVASARNGNANITCDNNAFLNMTTATTTQIVALSGSTIIYVCSFSIVSNGGTATNIKFVDGTGTNCATSQSDRSGNMPFTAAANTVGISRGSGNGMILKTSTAGDALCVTSSGAATVAIDISYAQF